MICFTPVLLQLKLLSYPFLYRRDASELVHPPEQISSQIEGDDPQQLASAVLETHGFTTGVKVVVV